MSFELLVGDVREQLATMAPESVQCCVTSPPYWGLRDYGVDGQLGLEATPEAYVAAMVEVFREVRRVLRDDGTLWLNIGDSYAGSGPSGASYQSKTTREREGKTQDGSFRISKTLGQRGLTYAEKKPIPPPGLKSKDLCGIPWRVAFALQADGWYLRSDIIWAKPNPMPESVRDRPTKAHEYIFLMSKSPRYFFDGDAVRETGAGTTWNSHRSTLNTGGNKGPATMPDGSKQSNYGAGTHHDDIDRTGRNIRTVWSIAAKPFPGAHFAVFPPKLVEPCVNAGSAERDLVLDPFTGSGTTGIVAAQLGRRFVGVELNPEYAAMARDRIAAAYAGLTVDEYRQGQGTLFGQA